MADVGGECQPPKLTTTTTDGFNKPPRAKMNPLQRGIQNYLETSDRQRSLNTSDLPKRYTIYPAMLLLSSNFTTLNATWSQVYASLTTTERHALFATICAAFSAQHITHIAANAPISPTTSTSTFNGSIGNSTRSPTHLQPMHGDFGPATLLDPCANAGQPTQADFAPAFWVSSVQNGGITQVWAPRWTMFSRGNVGEKARVLGGEFPGLARMSAEEIGGMDVMDFYVGVGYFAFPYLRRGVRRVWGWEVNGWSVEGLRRGARENGWRVDVVRVDDMGRVDEEAVERVVSGTLEGKDGVDCVVFHGDNCFAANVMRRVREQIAQSGKGDLLSFRHANLGLLPSSKASWENALLCLDRDQGGWVHVHENVDLSEVAQKRDEILASLQRLTAEHLGRSFRACCTHIEKVKSFAPGVMHCVFDIGILSAK